MKTRSLTTVLLIAGIVAAIFVEILAWMAR